jgi:hypothetical protein
MVVHAYNPSIWEAEAGGSQDLSQPSYIGGLCLKKKMRQKGP